MNGRGSGVVWWVAAIAAVVLSSCAREPTQRAATPGQDLDAVRARHEDALLDIDGVVGCATGTCGGRPCLIVWVAQLSDAVRQAVPRSIEGFEVRLIEVGDITIQSDR